MYDDILVPTDGSPAATAAIEHAVDLAKTYDATIHALYVVDASAFSSIEAGSELVIDALEEEGQRAVEEVTDAAAEVGVDVETNVVSGTAYRRILDHIDSENVDLVVMGTHGRSGVERFLLGSVTERVVRTADVPVLTIRHQDEEEQAAEAE
ncbi:universal stress protein [Halolamina salifodinae]|uniref:Nucleotide-binding universal stress UspA family protein n=1 Tax=Halolamina salifodinae TaxID=1202767 RepID=A0A8T4GU47_9EURY|nr:universal stress protein [Halolamina salifodinae]MBP1985662.1 nucleotide-binding universal stress UspA family protein [Halolamina salifodinae]